MSSTSTDQTPSVITTIRALSQVFSSDIESSSNYQWEADSGADFVPEKHSESKLFHRDKWLRPQLSPDESMFIPTAAGNVTSERN